MKYLFFIPLVLVFCGLILAAVSATYDSSGQNVNLYSSPTVNNAPNQAYVEVRLIDGHFDPPVIYVNKGDLVRMNFFFVDPVFVSLGNYVNDYYTTGMAVFVADRAGEYTIYCEDCYEDNHRDSDERSDREPAIGYFIVR